MNKRQYKTVLNFTLEVSKELRLAHLSRIQHIHLQQVLFRHPSQEHLHSLRWNHHYSDSVFYDIGANYQIDGIYQLPFDNNLFMIAEFEGFGDATLFDNMFNLETIHEFIPMDMRVKFMLEDGTAIYPRCYTDIISIYTYEDGILMTDMHWSREGLKTVDLSRFKTPFRPTAKKPIVQPMLNNPVVPVSHQLEAPSKIKQLFQTVKAKVMLF